ncbi:DoxX family protein [Tomitella biformata]|uniref:DoxX family protein n=1 Tax=Tomitella biformata TaxID=630403 RepID=UPI0004651D58|nr:DoxX family protein [Tomitella biformata]
MSYPLYRDLGLLLARVGLGAVFLAHGLQKLNVWGLDGTTAAFESMGVPAAGVTAFLVMWLEVLGGIALIIGLLTPVIGALFVLDMAGAIVFTHFENGLWVGDGGYELVLVLGLAALMLAVVGAGRISVDGLLGKRVSWLAPRALASA